MLMYAYRLVNGDRITGTVRATVDDVKNRMAETVTVEFSNGVSKDFPGNQFMNISHRPGGVARPKYKPEHKS